jgi:NAD-dependent SIR2 family protein deacetylase
MPADSPPAQLSHALSVLAGPLVVLTGAGLSTDSGIPDYRGPQAIQRQPMTYQEFVSGAAAQRRYWARSFVGWPRMNQALPNRGHRALAQIAPHLLITQNVDGLHEEAGSDPVVALHGRIADVICLDCGHRVHRVEVQAQLNTANPEFADRTDEVLALPDGDAEVFATRDFVLVSCSSCGGRLKPDVVFFGENVPAPRVERSYAAIEEVAAQSGALLVAGSSLTVQSGLRFVRRAASLDLPVVIINQGATRADELAHVKLDYGCSEFLEQLLAHRQSLRT